MWGIPDNNGLFHVLTADFGVIHNLFLFKKANSFVLYKLCFIDEKQIAKVEATPTFKLGNTFSDVNIGNRSWVWGVWVCVCVCVYVLYWDLQLQPCNVANWIF